MILGHKFHGVAHNLILGPLFGIVLLVYAFGIWNLRGGRSRSRSSTRSTCRPTWSCSGRCTNCRRPTVRFILVYLLLSLTGSIGTAIYLAYHRERLG